MGYLLGCLMAALSFLLNRAIVKQVGVNTVLSYSLIIEESAKTLPAFFLGADILTVHITFGFIEGVYDWYQNSGTGVKAALLSIGGHSLFGAGTVLILALSGSIWLGLAAGVVGHLAWNATVIRQYSP